MPAPHAASLPPGRLTIAGLASAARVGVETVRYYQRRGLLETPERGEGAGGAIRRYDESHVRRLRFIRAAQAARVRALATEQIATLDARIAALEEARAALQHLAQACRAGEAGPCPILAAFDR